MLYITTNSLQQPISLHSFNNKTKYVTQNQEWSTLTQQGKPSKPIFTNFPQNFGPDSHISMWLTNWLVTAVFIAPICALYNYFWVQSGSHQILYMKIYINYCSLWKEKFIPTPLSGDQGEGRGHHTCANSIWKRNIDLNVHIALIIIESLNQIIV